MKKVLSIVLSLVMVLCMMPVMAFAADEAGTTFTDASDIEHSEAVYSLAALNIIDGYTDGTYKPAKTVTRAEMSKIIATLLNGGSAPVLSTTTTTYTDTQGHWAAGYIEYCNSLGIVAGVGNGRFSPDATVTAEQAAKMLLIAQGYNADVEGLVGAAWASNTNVLANQNGYYKELTDITTAAGLTREHAAQMVYNVLDANVIAKTNSVNKETGVVTTTYSPTGQDVANKYLGLLEKSALLFNIEYDEKDSVYKYAIGVEVIGEGEDEEVVADIYKSAVDYTDLFGQNVKVLYKIEKGKVVVYGMYADESSVAYEGVYGDIDADSLKPEKKTVEIDGTVYKLDKGAIPTVYAEYNYDVVSASGAAAYAEIKAIDDEDDGDIDSIVYAPVAIGQVSYVGKTQFTVSGVTEDFDDEKVVAYDGMAKHDFVKITTDLKTGATVYTKLETLTNVKCTSLKGDNATINGTAYNNTNVEIGGPVAAGKEYDAVAVLNGYIVGVKGDTTTADVTKYAVVTGLKRTYDYDPTYSVRLLTSAGTEIEVPVSKDTYNDEDIVKGAFVKFKADDKYVLTPVADLTDGTDGTSGFEDRTNADFVPKDDDKAAKIGTYGISADAVVFVETTNDKDEVSYSVIKGSDLAAKTEVEKVNLAFISEDSATGFSNVALAYVDQAATTATNYAYVTDAYVTNVDEDNNTTYTVTLSTGTFDTTKAVEAADMENIAKGDIVEYTVDADNKIKEILEVVKDPTALIKYDGTVYVFEDDDTNEYKLADDATIIYINSEKKTVAEGGTVALADKDAEGVYIKNVKYVLDGDDEKIELLVVDINNKMV